MDRFTEYLTRRNIDMIRLFLLRSYSRARVGKFPASSGRSGGQTAPQRARSRAPELISATRVTRPGPQLASIESCQCSGADMARPGAARCRRTAEASRRTSQSRHLAVLQYLEAGIIGPVPDPARFDTIAGHSSL